MKKLLLLLFLSVSLWIQGQNFSDEWTGYYAYAQTKDITEGNGVVYVAADNAVFAYSTLDGSLTTRSTINGLSGQPISSIYYSAEFETLLVGYENGVIDVVINGNPDVLTVVDIFNKPSIPPTEKRINHFYEFNGFVYISSGFGISLFDLGRLEFDDSYFIGDNGASLNIFETVVYGDFVYAATSAGLRRALVGNSNIIDFNNWTTTNNNTFRGLAVFNDILYGIAGRNTLKSTNGVNFSFAFMYDNITPRDIRATDTRLTVTLPESIVIYDVDENITRTIGAVDEFINNYSTALTLNNSAFISTRGSGMIEVPLINGLPRQYLPDGPLENDIFNIEATANEVWAVYGSYDVFYNPFPLTEKGLSHFVIDSGWANITFEDALFTTDMVSVAINPQNPTQVFVPSFSAGLLEINEEVPTMLFDDTNSPLERVFASNGADGGVRVNSGTLDSSNNLWITNSLASNGLFKVTPGGQFQGISIADVFPDGTNPSGLDDIVFGSDGSLFLGTNSAGIVSYNPSNGALARIAGDEGAANLPSDDIRALAVDRGGTLWIGTRRGLRLLFSPSSIFEEGETTTNPIIILQDDIPQELLNDQVITEIVVDGANNKWISTIGSGVFFVSPNGQETLANFTTRNSPLPSNNVNSMSIDPQSGTIYFATDQGMVSFDGTSQPPAETLENVGVYPNPVRPTFSGLVTVDGLTARSNVKITDLVGNLVYEEVATAGNITWDTTAFGRHKVASGVYLILVTGPDALETKIVKLLIIR